MNHMGQVTQHTERERLPGWLQTVIGCARSGFELDTELVAPSVISMFKLRLSRRRLRHGSAGSGRLH
jgi:hypothetical protein